MGGGSRRRKRRRKEDAARDAPPADVTIDFDYTNTADWIILLRRLHDLADRAIEGDFWSAAAVGEEMRLILGEYQTGSGPHAREGGGPADG